MLNEQIALIEKEEHTEAQETPSNTSEIMPEDERLQTYIEAVQKTETHPVSVEINGEIITANVGGWEADFRTPEQIEAESSGEVEPLPVGIFCGGLGQVENVSQDSNMKTRLVHHAESELDGYGRLMEVGTSDVPTKVESSQESTYATDAELIATNLYQKLKLSDGTLPPLRLYGYSEGAGVATSLARALQDMEVQNSEKELSFPTEKGKNHLTLFNLTGIAEGSQNPNQARSALYGFLKTASQISWIGIKEKFPQLSEDVEQQAEALKSEMKPEEKPDEDSTSFTKLKAVLDKVPTGKDGPRYMLRKLLIAKKDRDSLHNHLTKLMRVNPDTNQLQSEWDVTIRAPRGDKMFDALTQLRYLQEEKQVPAKTLSPWADLEEAITKLSFPKANNVKVTLFGERNAQGKVEDFAHHQSADFYPEISIPDDDVVKKEELEELKKDIL